MGALEGGHEVYQTDGPTGLWVSVSASYGGTWEAEIYFVICVSI